MKLYFLFIFYLHAYNPTDSTTLRYKGINGLREAQSSCGKSYGLLNTPFCNYQSQSIINGRNAAPGAWPWQLILFYDDAPACGAVLIYPDIALTAAHCTHEKDPDKFHVYGGFNDLFDYSENPEKFWGSKVSRVIQYPYYDSSIANNDISLLHLLVPANLTQALNIACLPEQGEMPPENEPCFATGWGVVDASTNESRYDLQETCLPIIHSNTCRSYHYRGWITPSMICAGQKTSTTCYGDSGGPLVCKRDGVWKLFGLTSWGQTCDLTEISSPAVFTKVSNFVNWVKWMILKIASPLP